MNFSLLSLCLLIILAGSGRIYGQNFHHKQRQQQLNNEPPECEYNHDKRTYFCKNVIDTFPNIFYGNYHLQCNRACNIKVFHEHTFPFTNNLLSFNASNSGIKMVGQKAFSSLANSQYLYLDHNEIVNVSKEAFSGLRQVYELDLSHNFMTDITPGFIKNAEVNSLSLSDNKIAQIPDNAFLGSMNIITLELENNRIQKLHSDSFAGLDSIEFLLLQNNQICHLPLGVFKHLHTLRHLNLANNRLNKLSMGAFSGLRLLQTLNLANNSIRNFDGTELLPINRLDELDLSGNGIYFFNAFGIHSNAPSLRIIHMEDNLFSCSLLMNAVQFFKSKNVEIVVRNGRYDLQNINGIVCIEQAVRDEISFKYFMKLAEAETKQLSKYFC